VRSFVSRYFHYRDGILEANRDDLVRQACEIHEFSARKLTLCRPASGGLPHSRRDRAPVKIDSETQVFPGVINAATVGDGVTHRLSGMAVLATAAHEGTICAGTGCAQRHTH
jgi:hypothetical protein